MNLLALTLAAAALLPTEQGGSLHLVYDLGPASEEEAREAYLEPLRRRAVRCDLDPGALELDGAGRLVVRTLPADLAAWSDLVERRGRIEIAAVAEEGDFPAGVLAAERSAVEALLAAWPGFDPTLYRSARPEAGGLRWVSAGAGAARVPVPLLVEADPARRFTTADLLELAEAVDGAGFPALSGRVARPDDFGDFTESLRDRKLAVVLDGEALVMPVVVERLPGEFVIGLGGRSSGRSAALLSLMLSGELPRVPVLVEVVGG